VAGQDESTAKRSPGRPPIPLERIVEAALQIVDEQGADALSMRTLAQRLDSGTTTLYRHFANRADVIAHVVDRIFGEAALGTEELDTLDWQQGCKVAAQTMFDVLRRHANVAPLLVAGVPIGPNALALRERSIAALLASGFPPELAARTYATLARYVLGFAIQLTGNSPPDDPADSGLSAVFHGLDPQLFPATIAVADHAPIPLEEEFAFGLDLIINGLVAEAGL